jgi:hypothetical protein
MTEEEEALSRELMELGPDVEVVHTYGEEHADEFAALKMDHRPPVRIEVLFSGDRLAEHEAALQRLMAHPDRLKVLPSRWSLSELQAVIADLSEMAQAERGAFRQWGPGWGVVNVTLRADKEVLAARLHERYGDAVSITLGKFPYPVDRPLTWLEVQRRGRPKGTPPEEVTIPNLEARLELSAPELKAGEDGKGQVVLRNAGDTRIDFLSEQPLVGVVVEPGSNKVVGGYLGAIAGTGLGLKLDPGEEVEIRLIFGSASFRREVGYSLPPGHYQVLTHVPVVTSARDGKPFTRRHTSVPPADLVITSN